MKTVLVSGAAGFIGSYITKGLLEKGYRVIGIDDYSKYGELKRWHDGHPNYILHRINLENTPIPDWCAADYIIHCCSKVGGIKYFHERAYDLFSKNAAIDNTVFAAALKWHKEGKLRKIVVMSSSMVYEGADREFQKLLSMADQSCCGPQNFLDPHKEIWPSKEDSVDNICPPISSYGHSKLSLEVQARAANDQYGLHYVIVRPFNASGSGEEDLLGDSHVIPDLTFRAMTDPDNFTVKGDGSQRRCFTHASDVSRGTIMAMENDKALNKAYNLSVPNSTSVRELAELIWKEIYGDTRPFNFKTSTPFKYDVQLRLPDVSLAKEELGFEAQIPLVVGVREVIEFVRNKIG